jgi:lipoic acid synthetase
VITSVTRDDLDDGGAAHFAETVRQLRKISRASIEILIPDFQGKPAALQQVISARPEVINHNLETVPRLYPIVRPQAIYKRSLELLATVKIKAPHLPLKSGLMLGLGESHAEVEAVLQDLYDTGCRSLTIGQYLQPSEKQLPVKRFVPPAEFAAWQETAIKIGFTKVASSPFVRSSYKAAQGGISLTAKP